MKRCAKMIVPFLLLGTILNVAVAWGCVKWRHPRDDGPTVGEQIVDPEPVEVLDPHLGRIKELRAAMAFVWWSPGYMLMESWPVPHEVDHRQPVPSVADIAPTWTPLACALRKGKCDVLKDQVTEAGGWPMLSLFRTVDPRPPVSQTWMQRLLGDRETELVPGYQRGLPTRIIWLGFAINTAFYAAILWLFFAFPFTLRRWRRIKRGLCPACGYDLRGSTSQTCPECGKAAKV